MGRFVLGILIVACLDVVFIAFTYLAVGVGPLYFVKAVETRTDLPDLSWMDEPLSIDAPGPGREGPDRAHPVVRTPFASRRRPPSDSLRFQLATLSPAPLTESREAILRSYGLSPSSGVRILRDRRRVLILYRAAPPPENAPKTWEVRTSSLVAEMEPYPYGRGR